MVQDIPSVGIISSKLNWSDPQSLNPRELFISYHTNPGKADHIPVSSGAKSITPYQENGKPVGKILHATLTHASNEVSDQLPANSFESLICQSKINNTRFLNKHFEAINRALLPGGTYVGCVESYEQFRARLIRQYPAVLRHPYHLIHFVVKRLLPKLGITKRLYFRITKGKNRVISLPEVLGRLVSCGFEPLEYREIDGLTWYAARKVRDPHYDMDPSYGLIVRLRRIGRNRQPVTIYKLRTMHPYAEYLQDYVYRQNNLQEGGKFDNDMRVTQWGRVMRRFWLDEQPMWWNYLKGDIKLVGVRPLSRQYFNLYPEEMQEYRIRFKPGLIPPFYSDMPVTFEEIVESERRYLQAFERNPWRTDARYLVRALYNIIFKSARSR